MVTANELWLTPLILLPGVALLIGSTAQRFGQLHTEFHHLLDHYDAHAKILSRHLVLRSRLHRDALLGLYISVAVFALSSLIGGVLAIWAPDHVYLTGFFTLGGILALCYSSASLIRDTIICMHVISEHSARVLEREAPEPAHAPAPSVEADGGR